MQNTLANQQIEASKITIGKLFEDYWFRVPEYQRSYVWGKEQLDELLDDLNYARSNNPGKEYFLGSIVLQKHQVSTQTATYECCDVLDGQQRLTTILLMMAVLRDVSSDQDLTESVKQAIFQKGNAIKNLPERLRIEFLIRDKVGEFVEKYVKNSVANLDHALSDLVNVENVSLQNMARMMLYLKEQFSQLSDNEITNFTTFLFNKVIVIYVASENLEDAFRLFTILNDRGIPLSGSDILKSLNVGAVESEKKRQQFAAMWEKLEGEFGRDDFDRFLGHLRTILVKEKARENLLKEYEKIYKDRILEQGEQTLNFISEYRNIYAKLIWFDDDAPNDYKLRNLTTIMKIGLATDWIPIYLAYYHKFKIDRLFEFLERLESKFSADWILQETPTKRLTNTYAILKTIEKAQNAEEVLSNDEVFSYNREELRNRIEGDVYGQNFARYILLKLEYLMLHPNQSFSEFNRISVEHVLPQYPKEDSTWRKEFTDDEREKWTHKISNLVLLSRVKNSQLNNRDFAEKKQRYFASSINIFPNINSAMQQTEWGIKVLEQRQKDVVEILMKAFK